MNTVKKLGIFLLGIFTSTPVLIGALPFADQVVLQEVIANLKSRIYQYRLDNGMQVVCITAENTNKVMVGSYTQVGGSHEEPSEWGMAHILEHMVFKGTQTRKEGDLDKLCLRFGMQIGRDYNAHTAMDHTFYYFNSDDKNWKVFADVIADSAQHLLVRPEALDSELQAISQEIKLHNQDQNTGYIFTDFLPENHPSVHKLIGYKEQVLRYTAEQVMGFYHKHYVPEKTTFFVCGNVQPADVLAYARIAFADFNRVGQSPRVLGMPQDLPFYAGFAQTNRTIYHTRQSVTKEYSWLVGPIGSAQQPALEYVARGLGRRIMQKYVDEKGYCFAADVGVYHAQYGGVFYVSIEPRPEYNEYDFHAVVTAELAEIAQHGLANIEMKIITHDLLLESVNAAEEPSRLPALFARIGAYADNPVDSYFRFKESLFGVTQEAIQEVTLSYLRPFLMNSQSYVPLPREEQESWNALQARVVAHEQQLLAARARTDLSAFAVDDSAVTLPFPQPLELPKDLEYAEIVLSNGLTVYWANVSFSPRCICGLVVKDADRFSIPLAIDRKRFAWDVAPELLMHGTDSYSEQELKDLMEANGVWILAKPGQALVGGLKNNIQEGLRLLRLVLDKTTYDGEYLERKKQEKIDALAAARTDLMYRLDDYINQSLSLIYPWKFGEAEVIRNLEHVTLNDVRSVVTVLTDPSAVAGVMVGDFTYNEARELAEKYFGDLYCSTALQEHAVTAFGPFPVVNDYVALPVERTLVAAVCPASVYGSTDTACLELLKNYFQKKIWDIREKTGLFYSCGCGHSSFSKRFVGRMSLLINTTPGNAGLVQDELRMVIQSACSSLELTPEVFGQLKNQFCQSAGTYCTTARGVVDRITRAIGDDYAMNYEREFTQQVEALTFEQFADAVNRYCDPATWSFITVGARVA